MTASPDCGPTHAASLRSPFMDNVPPVSLLLMSQELRPHRCRSRLYIVGNRYWGGVAQVLRPHRCRSRLYIGLLLAYQSIYYIHYLARDAYLPQRSQPCCNRERP
jgi:hypothetical protein